MAKGGSTTERPGDPTGADSGHQDRFADGWLRRGDRVQEYEVRRLLGAGGMGEVYLSWDCQLRRQVALKVVRSHRVLRAGERERFWAEARTTARLSHPNIVTVYRMGDHRGVPFIAMERLHGKPLSAYRGRALAPGKVLSWIVPVVRALVAAHESGIVHRDLKPENIFICRDGQAKVLDFGLAALGMLALEDTALPHEAPGVGSRSQSGGGGDLWAIGVILYELCAGRPPFAGDDLAAVPEAAHPGDPPPDLREVNRRVSPDLATLVSRLLDRDPGRRPGSAAILLADLEAIEAQCAADASPDPKRGDPSSAPVAWWVGETRPPRWDTAAELLDDWDLAHPPLVGQTSPTGRDIPGQAVAETVSHFRQQGGDVSALLDRLNRKIRARQGDARFVELHPGILADPGCWYSNELNFLLVMATKAETGDPGFRYLRPDGAQLSVGHKIYELGFHSVSATRRGPEEISAAATNLSSIHGFLGGDQVTRRLAKGQDAEQKRSANRADLWLAALNSFLSPGDVLSTEMLADPQAYFPVRASQIGFDLAKVIDSRSDVLDLACQNNFTRTIRLMAAMLSIQRCFRAVVYFGNKYTKALRCSCLKTTRASAVVNVEPSSDYTAHTAPYFRACMSNSCDLSRGTMSGIITTVYGLSGAESIDTTCCVHDVPPAARALHVHSGAEDEPESAAGHCQYLFRWTPRLTGYQRLASPAGLAALAVPPALLVLWASDVTAPVKALAASELLTLPIGFLLVQRLRQLGRTRRDLDRYVREQEARFNREWDDLALAEVALHHGADHAAGGGGNRGKRDEVAGDAPGAAGSAGQDVAGGPVPRER